MYSCLSSIISNLFVNLLEISVIEKFQRNGEIISWLRFADDICCIVKKGSVRKIIGPIAKPDEVQIVNGLPKTRSGKIMRRILRKVASKDISNLGDTSTLLNPEVVAEIIDGVTSD